MLSNWIAMKNKYVYSFQEGRDNDIHLLGLKGAKLCHMYHIKIPVSLFYILNIIIIIIIP
jgi:phosphoenolpyruvate synthase/pyruvate phosphate dikinase